jgi:5-formyltetrahydrofolate cyclo-ligase
MRREMMSEHQKEWKDATAEIAKQVAEHPLYLQAADIYCYVDYNGEVGTRAMIEEAWRQGKNVWVPRVLGAEMEFFQIHSYDELLPGTKGILEPEEGIPGTGENGLMIMPGVAYDRALHRIGYGGGYYDKYLEKHPQLKRMAIAFDYQVMEAVPCDVHDIQPEILITESQIFHI